MMYAVREIFRDLLLRASQYSGDIGLLIYANYRLSTLSVHVLQLKDDFLISVIQHTTEGRLPNYTKPQTRSFYYYQMYWKRLHNTMKTHITMSSKEKLTSLIRPLLDAKKFWGFGFHKIDHYKSQSLYDANLQQERGMCTLTATCVSKEERFPDVIWAVV